MIAERVLRLRQRAADIRMMMYPGALVEPIVRELIVLGLDVVEEVLAAEEQKLGNEETKP